MPIQSLSSEIGNFLTPVKSWKGRRGNCGSRAKESDQTDPVAWKKKRKKVTACGRTASLEEELHGLCLTPSGGCSLSTLAYEGDKNTTKWKLKISLYNTTTAETNFLTFSEGPTQTRQGGLSVKTRLVTPKCLPPEIRTGVPSCCSNDIWGSHQAKWRKPVSLILLSSTSRFQAFGTREPQWERTPLTQWYEKHEKELTAEGSVYREEFDQP